MDIKKIRKAVMSSMGIMSTTTDTAIKEIWRSLDEETQEKFLKKAKGAKDVTSIDSGKLRDSSIRTSGDGESSNVPVSMPVRKAAEDSATDKRRSG